MPQSTPSQLFRSMSGCDFKKSRTVTCMTLEVGTGASQALHTLSVQLRIPSPQPNEQVSVTGATAHTLHSSSTHVCVPVPHTFWQLAVTGGTSHGPHVSELQCCTPTPQLFSQLRECGTVTQSDQNPWLHCMVPSAQPRTQACTSPSWWHTDAPGKSVRAPQLTSTQLRKAAHPAKSSA